MNTANWIPTCLEEDGSPENWTLFRSNEVSDLHDLYGKALKINISNTRQKRKRRNLVSLDAGD